MHRRRSHAASGRICAAVAGAALAGGVGAPALAQANATIVLGESPARVCYEHAAAGNLTAIALDDCTRAFTVAELSVHDRAATHANRALIKQARGDLDGALADLVAAARIDPSLTIAHLNLGGLHARLGQWAEARAALDRGIALDPAGARATDYFTRAAAREELGDVVGAYADYQAAAQLDPEWELPRLELSRFQISQTDGAS